MESSISISLQVCKKGRKGERRKHASVQKGGGERWELAQQEREGGRESEQYRRGMSTGTRSARDAICSHGLALRRYKCLMQSGEGRQKGGK